MPELPEVETVRLQLRQKVLGKKISRVEVWHQKTIGFDKRFVRRLRGQTFNDIERVGKLLIFSFAGTRPIFLLVHLKMTGQLIYVDSVGKTTGGGHFVPNSMADLPHRHTRLAFYFADGSALYFNDQRLFGYVKLADAETVAAARLGFGPEPIDPDFDCAWFVKALRQKKTPVKAALLNQAFVSGLGNIYVDEALWRAGIRPTRRANSISRAAAAALAACAGDVMREAIAYGGTTFQHFRDTGGDHGNFTDYLQVFGRQGEPCSRCGTTIQKIRCAGRGTHYCPSCQT